MSPALRTPGTIAGLSLLGGFAAAIAWDVFMRGLEESSPGLGWFLLIIAATVILLTSGLWSGRLRGSWARWLVVPLVILAIDITVYSNPVVDVVGILGSFVLLATLGSWIARGPVPYARVGSFFLVRSIRDVLQSILGVAWIGVMIQRNMRGSGSGIRGRDAVLGLLIAIPFLIFFAVLFAAADPILARSLHNFFGADFVMWASRIIRRVLLAMIVAGYLAHIMTIPAVDGPRSEEQGRSLDVLALAFFAPLAFLFALFLGLQGAALFGGEAFLRAHDVTYASYAREGFGALLFVTLLAGGLSLVWYRACMGRSRALRAVVFVFLAEVALVAASAFWRITLYVDAYGLTLSRAYATTAILAVALGLGFLVVGIVRRYPLENVLRAASTLLVVSVVVAMTLPVERIVAEWNVSQYIAGHRTRFDTNYHQHLSADAWPAYLRLPREWEEPLYRDIHNVLLRSQCGSPGEMYRDRYNLPPTWWRQPDQWQSYNALRSRWCRRLPRLQQELREEWGDDHSYGRVSAEG